MDPDSRLPNHLFMAFRGTVLCSDAVTTFRCTRAASVWLADPEISVTEKFLINEAPLQNKEQNTKYLPGLE